MSIKPKNDPLAGRLMRMRQKLGLTQTQMGAFFKVGRSTMSSWEMYGPPARGPVRMLALIVLHRLEKRHQEIKKHEAKKNAGKQNAMGKISDDGDGGGSREKAAHRPRPSVVGHRPRNLP